MSDYNMNHEEHNEWSGEYNQQSSYYGNQTNYNRGSGKKKGGFVKKLVAIILSAVLFGGVAGATMVGVSTFTKSKIPSSTSKVEITTASTEKNETDKEENKTNAAVTTMDVSNVVEQVMPSVVSITCTIQNTNYFYGTQESKGAGSGFILSKDKEKLYIATNNHVVNGATSLSVGFCDGSTAPAEIVGTDPDADLAVISIKAEEIKEETAKVIKVAVVGDSSTLKVGQPVIAIGNALGYGQSVTTGVISAKDREVSFTDGTMTLLQTDAAINPGNSGGVLINQKGEVIGINNAKLEDTSVEGMGYAIPMSTAQGILTDLMNVTEIKAGDEAYLGIVGKTLSEQYSEALGMPSGIYVTQVVAGSPAEKAGISAGDVITGYEGSNISTMEGLKNKLARKKGGEEVNITLQRANQNGDYEEQKVKVTLGKKSDFEDVISQEEQQNQQNNGGQQNNGNQGDQYNNGNGYMDPFEYFFGNGFFDYYR